MKTKLKFGLAQAYQHAPRWLVTAMSLLSLALAAKHYIIEGLPALSAASKVTANAWADYLLEIAQVVLAIVLIFSGEHKIPGNHDDTGN